MEVYKEGGKVLQLGKKTNSNGSLKRDSVITRVVSFLTPKTPRYIVTMPLNRPIGKVMWTVQYENVNVTFRKKKEAKEFQKLLAHSVAELPSVIIRREVTDEGYEPTYNGGRK